MAAEIHANASDAAIHGHSSKVDVQMTARKLISPSTSALKKSASVRTETPCMIQSPSTK
ncbi:hypothetical protein [Synechococcus sp. UW179A]|uniref:hypothetical protein n=1 Tax=Synechococcus sp. UW179A TaxID=2575510 RepID=UPI001481ECB4|nr:hypothetical protein [Synechococcus sp. UW179A]